MRLFKQKKTAKTASTSASESVIACLDIEESKVSAALFKPVGSKLRLIGYGQSFVDHNICLHQSEVEVEPLSNAAYQALKDAKGVLEISLKNLAISVSGSFVQEVTYKSKYRRPVPNNPFSPQEWQQVVLLNQTDSLQQAWSTMEFENFEFQTDLELLNSSLVGFALDGQPVLNPLGQPASFIGLQLYNVFLAKTHSRFCQVVADKLGLNLVALAYKPFALARMVLGQSYKSDLDLILIHIETHFTHVLFIRNGTLVSSQRFELGSAIFDNALKRNLDINRFTVDGLKNPQGDFSFSSLEPKLQQEAVKILNHTNSVWLLSLMMVLKNSNLAVLPSNICLTGSGANYNIISRGLQKSGLQKSVSFKGKLNVKTLNVAEIEGIESGLTDINENHLMVLVGLGSLTNDLIHRQVQAKSPGQTPGVN